MRMPRFTLGVVSYAARLLQDCGMGRARIRGSLVLAQAKHKEAGERRWRYTSGTPHCGMGRRGIFARHENFPVRPIAAVPWAATHP